MTTTTTTITIMIIITITDTITTIAPLFEKRQLLYCNGTQ